LNDDEARILVIRFSSLGDLLLTAPAVRALRRRFPDSPMDLLVADEFADAAALIPGPDRVLSFDRRSGVRGLLQLRRDLIRRYAVLVDLQNSFRSAFLRATTLPTIWVKAERYRVRRWILIHFKRNWYRGAKPVPVRYLQATEMLGAKDDEDGLRLRVPHVAHLRVSEFLEENHLQDASLAVLCPGARHFTKRWPEERWLELGRMLTDDGYRVVWAGSSAEGELIDRLSSALSGSLTVVNQPITQVAAIFERASVVVSNDSGLMHLAAGVGTPLVAIFGPTVEEFGFFPYRARSEILFHDLYCRPCSAMGSPRCPQKHFRCMLQTDPVAVIAAIHRVVVQSKSETP
jgi:lipopolysaccharide heptosyltransferase II